jgi:hypothetical protein
MKVHWETPREGTLDAHRRRASGMNGGKLIIDTTEQP